MILSLAVFTSWPLFGQIADSSEAALVPQTSDSARLLVELRHKWDLEGIETAIESGFMAVADTLSLRLLEADDLSPETQELLLNHRLHISLVQGNLASAEQILAEIEARGFRAKPLFQAFFHFFTGELFRAEDILESVSESNLSPDDRAWKRLLEGLIISRRGNIERAFETIQEAEDLAPNNLLRDQFEIIRLREELRQGTSDDTTISALRESVRSMRGERGGFEAARLLAIALNSAGDSSGAIEVLSSQLTVPGLREFNLRSEFLLLLGTLAGSDSTRGGLALREIVAIGANPGQQSMALTMLAESVETDDERESLLADIGDWLVQLPPHPLADRLLAYQAYFLSLEGDFEAAGQSARDLLQQFPTSSFAVNALRMLAYASWNQNPPRYRSAAGYLSQLRQRFPNTEDSLEASILIADCYFLNGDFSNASDAYGAALKDAPPEKAPKIFYQRVLAEIAAARPSSAASLIDQARLSNQMDVDALWRAEWNLLDYLRREERTDEAYQRIDTVLGELSDSSTGIATDLSLRFLWLEARLTLEAGPPMEAVDKAQALLDELDQGVYASLPESLTRAVRSHLLLLKGEAQIASGQRKAGVDTFAILRGAYPGSGPTILSYLVESRSESDSDNLVNAQQSLVALVDRFPASEYAPIALWEAALNAEQRGLNIHLQEAIGILERLVTSYPSHELVYYSRLKQGDLARRLNDFPTALLLYERLLSLFPNHPERYRAEISRADCLMAIGSEDPARYDQAAVIYERNCLLPSVPLPVRIEAGFKWAHSLKLQGDRAGAESVYWLLYERFVQDVDLSQTTLQVDAGRYWLARILLELGDIQSAKGEVAAAKMIFETVLQMNLPGTALAQSRLDSLQ